MLRVAECERRIVELELSSNIELEALITLPDETMGTRVGREFCLRYFGRSSARPAPEKMKSIPSSMAAMTIST
jgi:hypothetical protein